MSRFRSLSALLVVLLLFVGFGSAQQIDNLNRSERAEIRFLQGMSDHHQMALDMAEICLEKAYNEDVRAICQAVIDAQTPEIEQMQMWLLDWYNIEYQTMSMMGMMTTSETNDTDMNHSGMAMPSTPFSDQPMMMGMMAGFNRWEGIIFDIAWLESMIDHHDDAIHMAERVLERHVHNELATLAQEIIDAQSAEIEIMEAVLLDLDIDN